MKLSRTHVFSGKLPPDSSTMRLWRKSEKVEIKTAEKSSVKKFGNCGVEREKLWRILWNSNPLRSSFSHSVESEILEKVEIYFRTLQKRGVCGKTFQPSFQHYVETPVERCLKQVETQVSTVSPSKIPPHNACVNFMFKSTFNRVSPAAVRRYAVGGLGFFSRISLIISSTSSFRFASFFSAEVTLLIAYTIVE